MLRNLLLIFWLLPLTVMGQYHITGRVIDKDTKKPVGYASVFLSNASAGTQTKDDGTFTITNVRGGQYEMVISFIGYAPYRQTVLANADIDLGTIELSAQVTQLKEVRIGTDKHWAEHYAIFKQEFLGSSDNAARCEILNPHVLDFDYKRSAQELTASAGGSMTIINKALGYKITYQLMHFVKNTQMVYYDGTAFFEDLPGNPRQIKRWKARRQEAYLGSSMHFLRSVIAGQAAQQGFKVERLIRKPNPAYKGGPYNKYIQTLVDTALNLNDYARLTDIKGEFAIEFKDCLYITYKSGALDATTLTINAPYAYFDNNGIILNPQDVIMEGGWAVSRVAEMLPVDYEP